MKNTENKNTPERPDGSEQINAVVGTLPTYVEIHPLDWQSAKKFIQNQRELWKPESFDCQSCFDTGHYLKADEPNRLYFCQKCNKNGSRFDYGGNCRQRFEITDVDEVNVP